MALTQRTASPPHRITLILLAALSVLTLNMFLPSLANIAKEFDADYALVSLSIAGYLAVTAIIQLIVGPLSDRGGRRPVLLIALALFVIASIGCALAEDIWIFLAFRILQAGIATGYIVSLAIVRDTTSEKKTAGVIGDISTVMALAPMLGPVLGGFLDNAFGWRSNFYLYALSGTALLLICWVDLGETRRPSPDAAGAVRHNLLAVAREPLFWAYALCTAFSRGTFYIFIAGAPLVAASVFGVSTAELGLYIGSITAGFIVGSFAAGRLAPRFAPTTMMLAGRLIAIAGLILGLLFLAFGWLSPLLFFGSTVFVGAGNGVTIPSSSAGAMSVRPDLAGGAAGLEGATTVSCGAVLTALTGMLVTGGNAPETLLVLILGTACAGLLATWIAWRNQAPPAEN